MNIFSQILNQSKLGTSGQFSGGTFGSINTQDFQSKAPTIQKSVQAEQNLLSNGYSPQEVNFLKIQKQKGKDPKQSIEFIKKKREEAKLAEQKSKGILGSDANRQGFMQNALGVGADIIGGAVSEVPKFAGETASFFSKAGQYTPIQFLSTAVKAGFSDKTIGELLQEQSKRADTFSQAGQKGKELIQSTGLYDPTTLSAKGGELVTDIAGSLIGPNKVGVIPKLGKLAVPAKLAMEGGLAGAKFDVGTKGEITPESVAIGTALGPTIPLVGKAISKGGTLIKKSGKALYKTAIKPNVQEAERIIASEATTLANKAKIKAINASKASPATKAKKIAELTGNDVITRADTSLKYGITGTEKGIGVKGKAESSKLWNETVGPAIQKSKAQHNIDDMFAKAEKVIANEKSVLRRQELMDGLNALKDDYASTGKKIFTTGDIQAEKSMLDEFTPSKIWKGKEVAQGYTQAKNTLANIFREQVRDDLGKVGVKNAKGVYQDYANLSALSDIGVKGITEGGLKGGFGTFWSTVYDKVATPIKTVGGKYIYKLGNGIEYVGPKGMDTLGKYLKSKGYKVSGGNIIKLSKYANPIMIRSGILSTSPDTRMDRVSLESKKIK